MAITWVGKNIECLTTDVASLPTTVPANTYARDTQLENFYRFNGSAWVQISGPTNQGTARWYIYRTGTGSTGPYKALNKRTGVVVYSGADLDSVLDPVLVDVEAGDQGTVTSFLSSGGHIYIDGSDAYYYCSAGFDGFTIPQYTTIEGPLNARILVPNAYAGYVFRIPSWYNINSTKYTSSTQGITIKGMSMHEAGTTAKEWTGILVEGWAEKGTGWASPGSHSGGVAGCGVLGTRINNCKRGLWLKQINEAGWITSSWFEKVYIAGPKWAGVDQDLMGDDTTNENEFADNIFRDVVIQSTTPAGQTGTIPAFGFRNMGHRRCIYDNCLVWDTKPGCVKGNFDPKTRGGTTIIAEDNEIRGGILADTFGNPSSGTFSSSHALVNAGYYTAGTAYPKYFQDPADNTYITNDWLVGTQLGKIYIPPTGGLGGTAVLSIEGRKTDSNTQIEVLAASDTISSIMSFYNASKSERFMFTKATTTVDFDSVRQTAGGTLRPMRFRMNDVPGASVLECFRILIDGNLQMADARNIVLNATTGTKIGTGTTQKLGFYNKTPIVQPAAIAAPTAGTTVDTEARAAINSIRAALTALGLTA